MPSSSGSPSEGWRGSTSAAPSTPTPTSERKAFLASRREGKEANGNGDENDGDDGESKLSDFDELPAGAESPYKPPG
jgi:hypothetical protein